MKGTEKQIAFAERLIEKFDKEMNGLIAICPDQYKGMWVETKEKIDNIFSEAYAGDVIDLLKGNYKEGQEFYKTFHVTVRLSGANAAEKIKNEVFGR